MKHYPPHLDLKPALLSELDSYLEQLAGLRALLAERNGSAIEAVYANAQRASHQWITTIEAAEKQNKQGGD